MKFLRSLSAEDKLVIVSLSLTFAGILLAASLSEPRMVGLTAGVLELWADWIHVAALHPLVYTDTAGIFTAASFMLSAVFWYTILG